MSTPVRAVATRSLPHRARIVFAAWLDPAQFAKWMFPGDELLSLRSDPVVGGRFCFTVRRDGYLLHHVGRYVRIEQARGLSFTWDVTEHPGAAVSLIDVMLRPSAAGCFVTVTRYLSPCLGLAEVAQHEADLCRMLDNLSDHLRQASAQQTPPVRAVPCLGVLAAEAVADRQARGERRQSARRGRRSSLPPPAHPAARCAWPRR